MVGVDGCVVGVGCGLARGGALFPQPDGFLGLALGPVDGLGVGLQGEAGFRARGGGMRPLGRLGLEHLPEGVGAEAVPVPGVQMRQPGVPGVEGHGQLGQVQHSVPDLPCVPVQQLVGFLGLPELLLAECAPMWSAKASPLSSTQSAASSSPT